MKIAAFQNLGTSGAKVAFYNFLKHLRLRGHQIDLYAFDNFFEKHFDFEKITNKIYRYSYHILGETIEAKTYFVKVYLNHFQKTVYFRYLRQRYQNIAHAIDKGKYDCAFVHNDQYTQAPYLLRYLKTPSVYYSHEPLREIYDEALQRFNDTAAPGTKTFSQNLRSMPWRCGLAASNKLIKDADRGNILSAGYVLCNSQFTKASLRKAYGIEAEVCYPGVDVEYFHPLHLPRENFVLCVGGIDVKKNHDFIIESLARIDKSRRPKFILVGPWTLKSYKQHLITLAKKLDVNFEIKELIAQEEILQLYNRAKLVVYTPIMEPLGLVPLEAMACGTPVVGVDEGGIKETVINGKTGILVKREAALCAQAIEKLYNDETLYNQFAREARHYVAKEWNWDRCTQRLEEFLLSFPNALIGNPSTHD